MSLEYASPIQSRISNNPMDNSNYNDRQASTTIIRTKIPKRLKPTCDSISGVNNHYVQSQEPKSRIDNRQMLDHFEMDTTNNTIDPDL